MTTKTILTFVTIIFLTACNSDIEFEKTGWTERGDLGIFPNREKMLNDLITNHRLKGSSYRELIDLIGEPEKNLKGDSNTIYYNITVKYGYDIDPVYSKTLVFVFNKDSILTEYKIDEWKK